MADQPSTPDRDPNGSGPPSGQKVQPAPEDIFTPDQRMISPGPPPPPVPHRPADPPLHILAALVTIVLDWIWFMIELPATISIAFLPTLLPLSLSLVALDFAAVTLVQHYLAGEGWGKSAAKGLVMGIVAAVPYPVFGTVVGVPLAAWAGIREIQKWLPPKV